MVDLARRSFLEGIEPGSFYRLGYTFVDIPGGGAGYKYHTTVWRIVVRS